MNDVAIVAAAQFNPELLNVQKNLAVATELAFEAAAKGARVIVLPELCTSGFALRSPREAMECAQERDGYQTEAFIPIANRYNCYIVFGYPELYEGKLYNSAAIVGPSGLAGNSQKSNLWGNDNIWAQPSEALHALVVTPVGRLGALVCRDAMNHYRESYAFYKPGQKFYSKGSVDMIALLTNWGGAYGYPDSAWVELVEDTRANVIVSNRVGTERDLKYKGGSCCIDRERRIYTHGSSFTEAAIVGGMIII